MIARSRSPGFPDDPDFAGRLPGEAMLHPVMLSAVVLLVVNDHVLKHAFPGAVTGKLSDVAGLCFFPVLLATVCEIAAARFDRRPRPWVLLVAATAVTALVFTAVQVLAAPAEAYRVCLGALQWPMRAVLALAEGAPLPHVRRVLLTPDLTDLFALPAVATGLALRLQASR